MIDYKEVTQLHPVTRNHDIIKKLESENEELKKLVVELVAEIEWWYNPTSIKEVTHRMREHCNELLTRAKSQL